MLPITVKSLAGIVFIWNLHDSIVQISPKFGVGISFIVDVRLITHSTHSVVKKISATEVRVGNIVLCFLLQSGHFRELYL